MEFMVRVAGQDLSLEPEVSSTLNASFASSGSPVIVVNQHPDPRHELERLWEQLCKARDEAVNRKKSIEDTLAGLRAFDTYAHKNIRSSTPGVVAESDSILTAAVPSDEFKS